MRKILCATALFVITSVLLQMPSVASPPSYNEAVSDYNAGMYAKALSKFESCKSVYPNNPWVRYYEALCLQNVGSFDAAKAEYQWVAVHSSASLKSMALSGLYQLSQARVHLVSYSTKGSYAASVNPAVSQTKGSVTKVLEFYADWCRSCKAFAPTFEEVKSRMNGVVFQSYNVDDDSSRALQIKYHCTSIPHTVFLDTNDNVLFNGSPERDADSFEHQIAQFH